MKFPSPYNNCGYYIIPFIKSLRIKKVEMLGAYCTLQKVRDNVTSIFENAERMTDDIFWHGWTGEPAKNMLDIENMIVQRLFEIYVICTIGLGEESEWFDTPEEKENFNSSLKEETT